MLGYPVMICYWGSEDGIESSLITCCDNNADDINPAINFISPAEAKRRAGIQQMPRYYWIPAFAGMNVEHRTSNIESSCGGL